MQNKPCKTAGVEGSEFYAVYPYGVATGNLTESSGKRTVSVTVPSVQTCNEAGNFANGVNVMAAYAPASGSDFESVSLAYQNVCGVLRLNLKGSATVRTITVRSKGGDKFSGKGTIAFDESDSKEHELKPVEGSGTSDTVCLSCPGGVRLTGDGVQFNIVVMPCNMTGGFDVSVVCDEGTFVTSSNQDNPIGTGKILGMPAVSVTAVSHDVGGVLPGVFSVSADKKVHFSKGNLYYDEGTGQWRFEDSQYDFRTYCGNDGGGSTSHGQDACIGGVMGSTPAGQWGLFGWSAKDNYCCPIKTENARKGFITH